MHYFSPDELLKYNGSNSELAYVAINHNTFGISVNVTFCQVLRDWNGNSFKKKNKISMLNAL